MGCTSSRNSSPDGANAGENEAERFEWQLQFAWESTETDSNFRTNSSYTDLTCVDTGNSMPSIGQNGGPPICVAGQQTVSGPLLEVPGKKQSMGAKSNKLAPGDCLTPSGNQDSYDDVTKRNGH